MSEVITVPFPFVRTTYTPWNPDDLPTAGPPLVVDSWRPGTETLDAYGWDALTVADGIGQIELTVVGRYTPPGYRERVFFTRQWIDPDGRRFGKRKLRVAGAVAFASMAQGYRYPFELRLEAARG